MSLTQASCPYTKLWLKHGPKRAAELLTERHQIDIESGMSPAKHRMLMESSQVSGPGFGICEYSNPFSSSDDCIQLIGDGWDQASSKAMCDNAMGGMAQGTLTAGATCPQSSNDQLAGYCHTKQGTPQAQAMPMLLSPGMMGTCEQVAGACDAFMQGQFVHAGACSDGSEPVLKPANAGVEQSTGMERCRLAPGPMGAAHQHARSAGYDKDCADAPGKNSPYQWPLRWQADFEMTSLPVNPNPDKAPFSSNGTVYYDFSNNWKRSDSVNDGLMTFTTEEMTDARNVTVLHRGSVMIFINHYENNTKSCRKMDLGVIGNVRPDWFMDARGMASQTQYLGNQHIFHRGKPTLVKQWRKSDFANMYFVMSILETPAEDGIHWPIQRNDPGEGFGDDALHSFFNHKILTEADRDIWFPDEGMDCVDMNQEGKTQGPPMSDLGEEHPSHLNMNEAGWFDLEYTASPDGPSLEDSITKATECSGPSASTSTSAAPVVQGGFMPAYEVDLGGRGIMDLCRSEEKDNELEVKATFLTPDESWVSIGFRPDEASDLCSMTPATVLMVEKEDEWVTSYGELLPSLHVFEPSADELASQYDVLNDVIEEEGDILDLTLERQSDRTVVSFNTPIAKSNVDVGSIPMIYGIGKTAQLKYHAVRGCVRVELSAVPSCGDVGSAQMTGAPDITLAIDELKVTTEQHLTEGFASMEEKLGALMQKLDKLQSRTGVASDSKAEGSAQNMCLSLDKETCKEMDSCRWSRTRKSCHDTRTKSDGTARRSYQP